MIMIMISVYLSISIPERLICKETTATAAELRHGAQGEAAT